jgi:hypothetical protein
MTTTQKKKDLQKRLLRCGLRRSRINFLQCFDEYLKEKPYRTNTSYRVLCHVRKTFLRYAGKIKVFDFTKFNLRFVLKFESWLKTGDKHRRPMGDNTVKVYMAFYECIHRYIYKKHNLPGTPCFKKQQFEPPVTRLRRQYNFIN